MFNPFNTEFNKITPKDLDKLLADKVTEGYFVEYKGDEFPAPIKIARSIAAFANTHGGWYIVGVETNEDNSAKSLVGFDPAVYNDPISKVRDVIKSHIDPIPLFQIKLLKLENGNEILIVLIPDEQETSFITSDGRIYRRNHDSSDPIYEKDRYVVDRLVDLGAERKREFVAFCQDERKFGQNDENMVWLSIFLWPIPRPLNSSENKATPKDLEDLIQLSRTLIDVEGIEGKKLASGNVVFTSGHVTNQSIILRYRDKTYPWINSNEIEFFDDCCAKFFIPIPLIRDVLDQGNIQKLDSVEVRAVLTKYSKIISPQNINTVEFVNL